jgi:hypothetical protein
MRHLSILLILFAATRIAAANEPFTSLAADCDSRNTGPACAAAGDYLWDNNGKKLRDCSSESAIVCIRPTEGRIAAVARVDDLAFQYHSKACAQQHAEACNKAGVHFAIKSAGAPDEKAPALAAKAEALFEKACKLGSREGCLNVGTTGGAK